MYHRAPAGLRVDSHLSERGLHLAPVSRYND